MTLTLWRCKRLARRIWKLEEKQKQFKKAIETLGKWIKQDRRKIQALLKTLSDEENLQYGLSVGLIDNADYQIIKNQRGKRK